jgi:histone H4
MVLRDNVQGVTKNAIRRLARRAGCLRLSCLVYEETRSALRHFLETVLRDAVHFTEHARRRVVTEADVLAAGARNGVRCYGMDAEGLALGPARGMF